MTGRSVPTRQNANKQMRDSAMRHALSIEEKKQMRARVADLIIAAYDLPSGPNTNPACPSATDRAIFWDCLTVFQPSDLDDLVKERNIDNRCGYALCPNQNRKVPGGGEKVWNHKGGKHFQLLSKADIENWCSELCANRNAFVRGQLSSEPSWLRENQNDIRFLDDVHHVDIDGELANATKTLSIENSNAEEVASRLGKLSLERGELQIRDVSTDVLIVEKDNDARSSKPPNLADHGEIEGHRPRKVRFVDESVA